MANNPDTSAPSDLPERNDAVQDQLRVADTKGDSIIAGNVSGTGIAIGPGAQANVVFTEEQAYNVSGFINPYLGLRAFTAAERDIFAGRERTVRALVDRLSADDGDRLLFIVGASGSGKSSLARAGLLPNLADRLHEAGYNVQSLIIDHAGHMPAAALERILQGLQNPSDSPAAHILLILIDQFEELFSQADPAQRNQALLMLAAIAQQTELPMRMIATMRSDFLPQLVADARFEVCEQRKVVVRAMTVDELTEAIQRPIQVRYPDKRLEPALVERLASDAATDAAYLPLLQVTLEDLWRGGELRLSAYQGLADAIQRRADTVYTFRDYNGLQQERRTPEEQSAILDLFLDLVRVSLDDDQRSVRWRRPRSEVTLNDLQRERLVADLASARLLRTDREIWPDDEHEVETVDIVHEALLSAWPTLKTAIETRRETLRRRERFILALNEWRRCDHSDAYLLTGVRLSEAEALKTGEDRIFQMEGAAEYYVRSQQVYADEQARQLRLERRSRRQLLILTVILSSLLIATTIALVRPLRLRSNAMTLTPLPIEGLAVRFEPYEVTNARYKLCVDARRCLAPIGTLSGELMSTYYEPDRADWPITGVTAIQAAAFCEWIGRRLPTQGEWNGAMTMNNSRPWPWGDVSPQDRHAVLEFMARDVPERVGSRDPDGQSGDGISDLIGNVWEFTSTSWERADDEWDGRAQTAPVAVTAMGGAFTSGAGAIAPLRAATTVPWRDIGFRCVDAR